MAGQRTLAPALMEESQSRTDRHLLKPDIIKQDKVKKSSSLKCLLSSLLCNDKGEVRNLCLRFVVAIMAALVFATVYMFCCSATSFGGKLVFNSGVVFRKGVLRTRDTSTVNCSQNVHNTGKIVPNVVHYVFIWPSDLQDLPYWVFLNIMSAIFVQKPDKIMFHVMGVDPVQLSAAAGRNWQRLIAIENFHAVESRDVKEIFGNPVNVAAHKSDIIRLEALLAEGGIYLDTDVILLRSLEKLLDFPMVMGMEGDYGLCNGVLIGSKNNPFLQRWYFEYQNFDDNNWNHHSVILPKKMARENPTEIVLLASSAFYEPTFSEVESKIFNTGNVMVDLASKQFALHLWGLLAKPFLDNITSAAYFCDDDTVILNTTYFQAIYPTVMALNECGTDGQN